MIDWSNLKTGSGYANHIPSAVKKLSSSFENERKQAYFQIENYAFVQNTLYESAYYVIDLLVDLMLSKNFNKLYALYALTEIALGCGYDDEIILLDNNCLIENLEIACKQKLKTYLSKIEKVKVETNEEKEELEELINIIKQFDLPPAV